MQSGAAGVPPLRILLVEDQSPLLRMLTRYLQKCGHAVDEAANGDDALDLVRRRTFDAILADVHLPGLSGIELTHHLFARAPRCVVILMTGDPDDDLEKIARQAGAAGYLRKPFSFGELDEVLNAALGSR